MTGITGLFRKYAAVLSIFVGGGVLLVGALEMTFNYRESRDAVESIQAVEVSAAAMRIEQYLDGIRGQLTEVSRLPWGAAGLDESARREEFHRLMKLVPSIAEVQRVDPEGRERLRVSRVQLDQAGDLGDRSADPLVAEARARGSAFGPSHFRGGSEPFVALAVREASLGAPPGVTIAEINLRFVGDVVTEIPLGRKGHVYVVDSDDHLIAHRNPSMVLRKLRLDGYAPLREFRSRIREQRSLLGLVEAEGLEGGEMLLSAAFIPASRWLVVAEQARSETMRPVYASMYRTGLLMGLGLLTALVVSYFLARKLAQPILELRRGATKIAGGDLGARIDVKTGDEIEALATEFNHMADQLEDYTLGLERKVAEKTAQLEEANRHKSEFLANMSHELRTPLNAVIGFSNALEEQMFGDLNPKQMEYVRDIHASGQHLLTLINDILDLAKIEAGRMELDVQAFDVRAALENCRTLIRERAQRHGLKLVFDVPPGLGTWLGDERKLKQIVINLLSNAVKFTPMHGEVRLTARRGEEALEITVADTGPGIAPQDQQLVFEEFRQLPHGEGKHEGTGLGLALARRFAELHGGTISLASEKGRGAAFTVRLPRRIPEAAHA
jgi:signal transduction histidine kinase